MNYAANAIRWTVGARVIHDADAKRADMLMEVVGYTKDGLARCRYADPETRKRFGRVTIYDNDPKYLHDPARFGIEIGHAR
jgi:hypothetical protein